MKQLILISIIISLVSCNKKETQKTEIVENVKRNEVKSDLEVFDKELIESLYTELKSKSDFEIDFSQPHLDSLLNNISISKLKEGEEFEKEMLFEDFQCDCYDKIKISYSKPDNRFILWVYEEFYEEDLDWCPESSYTYSFVIKDHEVTDLKLDFMAG